VVAGGALLGLSACASANEVGFEVVGSLPIDGDEDVVESVQPELRFNASADPLTCDASLVLVALGPEDVVAWEPEFRLVYLDDANKVRFELERPLLRERWYALSVQTGGLACLDEHGRSLQSFTAEFMVP